MHAFLQTFGDITIKLIELAVDLLDKIKRLRTYLKLFKVLNIYHPKSLETKIVSLLFFLLFLFMMVG